MPILKNSMATRSKSGVCSYLFAIFIHGILKRYNYVQFVQGRFCACKATKCWYSKETLPHWKYERQKYTFNNVEIDIDSLIISNLFKYLGEIWCYSEKKGRLLVHVIDFLEIVVCYQWIHHNSLTTQPIINSIHWISYRNRKITYIYCTLNR